MEKCQEWKLYRKGDDSVVHILTTQRQAGQGGRLEF